MTIKIFLDSEFLTSDMSPRGLYSLALAAETGEVFYAVNASLDITMSGLSDGSRQFMLDHVWPHLPGGSPEKFDRTHPLVCSYDSIREGVGRFFEDLSPTGEGNEDFTLHVRQGAQDVVRMHTLWNNDWSVMPRHVPRWADDMYRIIRDSGVPKEDLPVQDEGQAHHALHDALHEMRIIQFLEEKAVSL